MQTDRLILRYFELSDAKEMYENWGKDKTITKYMLWKNYNSIDDAIKTIKFYQEQIKNNTGFICYAIQRKEDNKLIGSVNININKRHKHGDLGYLIGKDYQKKGYMKEALDKLTDFYFSKGLVRISAEVMVDNTSSIKLLEKCNFKLEGRLRKKYLRKDGKYTDVFIYAKVS